MNKNYYIYNFYSYCFHIIYIYIYIISYLKNTAQTRNRRPKDAEIFTLHGRHNVGHRAALSAITMRAVTNILLDSAHIFYQAKYTKPNSY